MLFIDVCAICDNLKKVHKRKNVGCLTHIQKNGSFPSLLIRLAHGSPNLQPPRSQQCCLAPRTYQQQLPTNKFTPILICKTALQVLCLFIQTSMQELITTEIERIPILLPENI